MTAQAQQVQVDLGIVFLTLGINFLIAMGGWLVAYKTHKDSQKQKKLDFQNELLREKNARIREKINEFRMLLEEYNELIYLFGLFAHFDRKVEITEDGEKVVFGVFMEPESEKEVAMKDDKGRNISSEIGVQKLTVSRKYRRANGLAVDIDITGELAQDLKNLYTVSVLSLERAIKQKQVKIDMIRLNQLITEADSMVGSLRTKLNIEWEKTFIIKDLSSK